MLILAKFSCFLPLKRPLVDFFDLISYSAMRCSYTNSLTAIFTSFLESVTQNIRKYPKIAHFSVYFFVKRRGYGPLAVKFSLRVGNFLLLSKMTLLNHIKIRPAVFPCLLFKEGIQRSIYSPGYTAQMEIVLRLEEVFAELM